MRYRDTLAEQIEEMIDHLNKKIERKLIRGQSAVHLERQVEALEDRLRRVA